MTVRVELEKAREMAGTYAAPFQVGDDCCLFESPMEHNGRDGVARFMEGRKREFDSGAPLHHAVTHPPAKVQVDGGASIRDA
jgi:hypothetical protein